MCGFSEYSENIRVVDRGIQATVALIENFYNSDGQTAYVVSSDHGMTNWGKHERCVTPPHQQ